MDQLSNSEVKPKVWYLRLWDKVKKFFEWLWFNTIGLHEKDCPCCGDTTETYTRAMIRRWIIIGLTASIVFNLIWPKKFCDASLFTDLFVGLKITALVAFILPAILLIFRYVSYGNAKNMRRPADNPSCHTKEIEVIDTRKSSIISEDYQMTLSRLHRVVETSYWMAIINLFIGFLVTLVGFGLLIYFLDVMNETMASTNETITQYFIPRVSLVLLVELFAFFFLRLYGDNLKEWKYYQNEITSVEYKLIASRMAIDLDLEGDCHRVINQLLIQSSSNMLNSGNKKKSSDKDSTENNSIISLLNNVFSLITHKNE